MITFRKKRIYQVLLLVLTLTLSNCMTDEYDLSKGLNTDMTLGGDSLALPIGKTDSIFLGSIITTNDTSMLKQLDDGTYSLEMKDSIPTQSLPVIPKVEFSIAPITIAAISPNIETINFPSFQFPAVSIESDPLPIPEISISTFNVPTIDKSYTYPATLKQPIIPSGVPSKSKSQSQLDIPIDPITISQNQEIPQSLNFNFPTALKKINEILFLNKKVSLTFDKSEIVGIKDKFSSISDGIESFKIEYPSEFKLKAGSQTGSGTSIEGSTFIIGKQTLDSQPTGIYNSSFEIESLDLTKINQAGGVLNYSFTVKVSIIYTFQGVLKETAQDLLGKDINIKVSLSSALSIDDLNIETNDFVVAVPGGNTTMNQTITGIPKDISEVNSLTYEDGVQLSLNITDPGISPFHFSAGTCKITLPALFNYKPMAGLAGNILTIPAADLFTPKVIGISSSTLNRTVADQKITLSDQLKYELSNLTIASQTTMLNDMSKLNGKKIKIAGSSNEFKVKEAAIKTNRISLPINELTTKIDISQKVDNVKKIYSAALKTPSKLTLKIKINKLPVGIAAIYLDTFKISLPSCLKFKTGDVNAKNELVINEAVNVGTELTKVLTLEKFDFNATGGNVLVDGLFKLNETVTMKGSAHINSSTLNSKDIVSSSFEIKPSIEIETMTLSLVEAQVEQTIDPIAPKSIAIELPEGLGSNSSLEIKNPVIELVFGNTIGIPIDLNLSFKPYSKGAVVTSGIVNTTLNIAAAPSNKLGQVIQSKFRLSAEATGLIDDYVIKLIPNLATLLKVLPDSIAISATPTINQGQHHYIDLTNQKNSLSLKYSLKVPLSLGADTKIEYSTTIDSLRSTLKTVLGFTRNFDIVANVENTIPMDLALTVTPIDSNKVDLTDKITVNAGTIRYGTSKTSFGLKEKVEGSGALDKLDGFIIKVSAQSKSTALNLIPLKSDQYVIIELKAIIPKGISLKLDSDKK